MRKGHEIGRYMPKEIEPWKSSPVVRQMGDFQRSWFDEMLMEGWVNSRMPCHLPNDENRLWTIAGARSLNYFRKHSGTVMSQFRVCGEGQWICNGKSLELYLKVLTSHFSKKRRCNPHNSQWRAAINFIFFCSCVSEERKTELSALENREEDATLWLWSGKKQPEPEHPEVGAREIAIHLWSENRDEYERLKPLAKEQVLRLRLAERGQEKMAWFGDLVDEQIGRIWLERYSENAREAHA